MPGRSKGRSQNEKQSTGSPGYFIGGLRWVATQPIFLFSFRLKFCQSTVCNAVIIKQGPC